MSETQLSQKSGHLLSPWLQQQLSTLLSRRGHAWLLQGPSGLGQYNLALELARAWLCENTTPAGACYQCASCHSVDVRSHPDLCVLMPETVALELDWPLDEKSQKEIDDKKRKPSKEIRVDAVREMINFTQHTRSGGHTKVVLVYPAERMNHVTANAILKTLEDPPVNASLCWPAKPRIYCCLLFVAVVRRTPWFGPRNNMPWNGWFLKG